jgi:hypothetical protein
MPALERLRLSQVGSLILALMCLPGCAPELGFLLESGHSFSALGVGFSYFPDR